MFGHKLAEFLLKRILVTSQVVGVAQVDELAAGAVIATRTASVGFRGFACKSPQLYTLIKLTGVISAREEIPRNCFI